MIVVSDTTPLISLMKVSKLGLLESLFREVLIPVSVYAELTTNPNFEDETRQINDCPFIKVVTVKEYKAVDVLQRSAGLDLGESEAIIYADDIKADVLLMDEAKGRQVAKAMGLYIMGTVGVLLFAYEERILSGSDVVKALDQLRMANRHIGEDVIKYALSKIRD
ncbi:MAG TPA: DUF3368 domain-containing protein [Acidaminococcaceae bacterium]|nr:DUF3368 domain-containing protein [Acidaminococcaceae bacterium]